MYFEQSAPWWIPLEKVFWRQVLHSHLYVQFCAVNGSSLSTFIRSRSQSAVWQVVNVVVPIHLLLLPENNSSRKEIFSLF